MLNKLNYNDLKSITGGIPLLPDAANPLGGKAYGVLIDTKNGILCAYKGVNVYEGDLIHTINDSALSALSAVHVAAGSTGLPGPTGVDGEGCATYYPPPPPVN